MSEEEVGDSLLASLAPRGEPPSPELVSATLFAASTLFPGAEVDAGGKGDDSASATSSCSSSVVGKTAVDVPMVDSDLEQARSTLIMFFLNLSPF